MRPKPTIFYNVTFPFEAASWLSMTQFQIEKTHCMLSFGDCSADVSVYKAGGGSGEAFTIPFTSSTFVTSSTGKRIKSCVFNLFNFRLFESESSSPAIIHLRYENWIIDVIPLVESRDNAAETKRTGIQTVSHVGKIVAKDGGLFSEKDLTGLLEALDRFFNFVMGHFCYSICPVGFDEDGKQVYLKFNEPRNTGGIYSPFHSVSMTHDIETFFPNFMALWNDNDFHGTIWDIMYYYNMANDPSHGLEPQTIVAQAALEKICYIYMLKRMKINEKDIQDIRPTSEKIRKVLKDLSLDTKIPSPFSELTAWGDKKRKEILVDHPRWNIIFDGPFVLTEARNAYTHSETMDFDDIIKKDIWHLSLWYIEAILFRLCNYSGGYSNRLTDNLSVVSFDGRVP